MCRPPTVAPPSSAPLTSSRAALTYTPPAQKAPVYTPKAELTFSPPTVQQPSSNSLLTQDGSDLGYSGRSESTPTSSEQTLCHSRVVALVSSRRRQWQD
ncbi:hypothetical protein FRB94_008002 [Tulasnella sp. JGI-2019a]|nr:hypothetical protein FRB94_008002 [Tulasnella sp. JGI-2019a]KAG9027430.1 hypothetical protein FRB95_007765 [Tulasnella sp. JGI-2019a]